MRIRPLALAVFAVLLAACTSEVEQDYTNQGRACVSGEADAAVEVEVDFNVCLSSSCDELVDAECTATWNGETLEVEASGTVRSKTNTDCTLDCGQALVTCEAAAMPAGGYELSYAGQTGAFTLPDGGCVGEL